MANFTMIDQIILGASTTSVTFSSIPSTYTDLVLICQSKQVSGSGSGRFHVNGDTSNLYSFTYLVGTSSATASGRVTSASTCIKGLLDSWQTSQPTGDYGQMILHFPNYANTTTWKTVLGQNGSSTLSNDISVSMWRSTAAISSITLTIDATGSFTAGSSYSLYGITAAGSPKATGGTISTDGVYWYHTFGTTDRFIPNSSITADILQIAGGGGGGARTSLNSGRGGGGAGGLLAYTSQALTAQAYAITVGAGGAAGTTDGSGSQGSNSQFAALTASVGGGYGGGNVTAGGSGGAGGGAGGTNSGTTGYAGGTATSSQGFAGGNGGDNSASDYRSGGGGGGAGGAGGNAAGTTVAGVGGVGSVSYSAWGNATKTGEYVNGVYYYAGGGGGGTWASATDYAAGGYGGGGSGAGGATVAAVKTSNGGLILSGGGGGGGGYDGSGSAGGSGVVIVRYPV
jgi:hypothetical protein